MARFGMFLSLILLVGLVACGEEPEQATVDPGQLDSVLAEYSADRAAVIAAVGEARGIQLESSVALDRAAARHALDLASHRTATHLGQDGSHPMTRLRDAGAGMSGVREFIFRVESDPEDLGRSAASAWLAPIRDNGVLTEACTHAAVAFAPLEDGGCVGVLLLAQR